MKLNNQANLLRWGHSHAAVYWFVVKHFRKTRKLCWTNYTHGIQITRAIVPTCEMCTIRTDLLVSDATFVVQLNVIRPLKAKLPGRHKWDPLVGVAMEKRYTGATPTTHIVCYSIWRCSIADEWWVIYLLILFLVECFAPQYLQRLRRIAIILASVGGCKQHQPHCVLCVFMWQSQYKLESNLVQNTLIWRKSIPFTFTLLRKYLLTFKYIYTLSGVYVWQNANAKQLI